MTVLVVVAHQDDESLSCGGLIQRRVQAKQQVAVLSVFGRQYQYGVGPQYEQEQHLAFHQACVTLGCTGRSLNLLEGEPQQHSRYQILEAMETLCNQLHPRELVIPSPDDRNQDHRYLHELCTVLARPWYQTARRVLMWLSPDGIPKVPNWYEPMTNDQLRTKMKAVECYARESRTGSHPRSTRNLVAWHTICGSYCNEVLAEPYQLYYQRE